MATLRTVHAPTIGYGHIAYVSHCLQHLGIPADQLVLPPGPPPEPQTLVPHRYLWDLWESARTATGQSGWGVRVAGLLPPRMPGLLNETLQSSTTVVEALTVVTHASSLYMLSNLTLTVDKMQTFMELHSDYPEYLHPESAEYALASIVHLLWSGGDRLDFTAHFRHRAPAATELQQGVFGPNLCYGSGRYGLAFDTATVLNLRRAEPDLADIRDTVAAAVTANAPYDIVSQVEQVIRDQFGGKVPATTPTIESVATQLGLHPKNLNRQLAAHDTTFRALLDAYRRGASLEMLERPLSVQQIAVRLGYSDPAAFVRAFRRWNDLSPGAYRNRSGGDRRVRSRQRRRRQCHHHDPAHAETLRPRCRQDQVRRGVSHVLAGRAQGDPHRQRPPTARGRARRPGLWTRRSSRPCSTNLT